VGSFYANIVLRGAPREAVLASLGKLRREVVVSPAEDDVIVVYDDECEDQDLSVLDRLAARLTKQLGCAGLCFLNHDDDVLVCLLFRNGARVAQWAWDPTGFLEGSMAADPAQAFADAVAGACGCEAAKVRAALDCGASPPALPASREAMSARAASGPVFAVQVHQALVEAMGFGRYSVGLGHRDIQAGAAKELFGNAEEFTEAEPVTLHRRGTRGRPAQHRRRRKRSMFSFYTEIGLRGCSREAVIALARELGRHAYISPEQNGSTCVLDEECENQDLRVMDSLASTSRAVFIVRA